ncbi:hypothetical protein [Alistipes putredinis]|jgi:hypothetical protein|uniref:hypothetical protein n=1 Tax=Alistipes putredinis TaxID=28117 RepID=UPI002050F6FE|nr:MAG TPA: tail protein [Caudoviricetes sp.]
MIIYNNLGYRVLDVEVDDNSYRNRVIMGDHSLTLYYSLPEHVEIPVGAYCEFQGEKFTLERPENFKMKHKRLFEYTVIFEAPEAKAKIWKFRNPVDGRLKFSLTAKPIEHLQMFVDNMNRRDTGWTVGDCVDGVETLIAYDHDFCIAALQKQASQFNTEYEFVGKRVSLKKVEYNKSAPLPLSYGRGNGFKSGVGRSNTGDTPPIEILFVQGGTDNIDPSKYGSSELKLPAGQTLAYDGEHFENEAGFVKANARNYVVDESGLSIRRYDKQLSSLAEDSLDCSEIYPKRVGTVSSVAVVDAGNNFYDIIDTGIPSTLNYEECLIEGETMTIIFQSGMLAGREFEVKYYHEAVKNKAARRFEIVPAELDGQTMPNATFAPKAGDKYAVFKCMLPDSYIRDDETKTGASWDMFRAAVKYLFDNEEQKFTFTGELDGIWSKKDWLNIGGRIKLGGYILFSDEQFQKDGVLVRITGVKDYINKPYSPVIELSNTTVSGGVSSTLNELKSEGVVMEDLHRASIQFTKRRFRDAKETISMLEDALLENFTNSINPIAVQTMSMLVGDESLQFRFVNSKTNPVQVAHSITYDIEAKQLSAEAGIIQHMTLGIASISSAHKASEYKYWNMSAYTSGRLDDGSKKYYLYAKVSRTAQTGSFIMSETAIKMEAVSGFYHLLVGVLNSEYDGVRSFVTLYGFSEVLPGRVTTDRVVSGDGNSFFDFVANALKLGDKLSYNVNGDGELKIKGTIVQSQSGSESYIGCFRGAYNSSYTYYNGDEVTYTLNGLTSTYRYIYATPAKGVAPSNTVYWTVTAKGSKGADGTSITIKGTLSDTSKLPATGTEGDAYIINGDLYVWNGSKWENVGQIKGEKGDKGDDGSAGNYTELRFAKNGSTTSPPSLSKSSLNPSGWTTTTPSVGSAEYLWMTSAVKSGDGKTLVSQWTTPVRLTPYNGKDGADGSSPVMVYRGTYSSSKSYYGNKNRLDCVKNGSTYYIARIDAGTFSNVAPPNTNKWNSFGASFESVATNLLLAEGANIGDWFMKGGRIVSTLGTGDIIELDAKNKRIKITSATSGGSYSQENLGSVITLDAGSGIVETRSKNNSSTVSYMSPTGIFANRAGTQCVAASTGADQRAAICALGFGSLNKSEWSLGADERLIAGMYGYASNSGTAPSYGGYFFNLKIKGLIYGVKYITATSTYITDAMSLVVGFTSGQAKVYLPASTREGQTIIFKQWWTGYMRIYPRNGQKIFDDHTENEYYDVSEGQELIAHFVKAAINGENVQVWVVSKYKF